MSYQLQKSLVFCFSKICFKIAELLKIAHEKRNHFWKTKYKTYVLCSQDNMTFSDRGELVQVTNQVSTILLLGLFISRSLVSTLLLKPTECGLIDSEPSDLAASNLKVSCHKFWKQYYYPEVSTPLNPLGDLITFFCPTLVTWHLFHLYLRIIN